jgi:hypothetical protein
MGALDVYLSRRFKRVNGFEHNACLFTIIERRLNLAVAI